MYIVLLYSVKLIYNQSSNGLIWTLQGYISCEGFQQIAWFLVRFLLCRRQDGRRGDEGRLIGRARWPYVRLRSACAGVRPVYFGKDGLFRRFRGDRRLAFCGRACRCRRTDRACCVDWWACWGWWRCGGCWIAGRGGAGVVRGGGERAACRYCQSRYVACVFPFFFRLLIRSSLSQCVAFRSCTL